MKVYFTCSTAQFNRYKKLYFRIRNYLVKDNQILTRDWLPHTEKILNTGRKRLRDIQEIYKKCIKAIRDSDAVIIEDTVSNFSTGHQITKSLQFRKPTLVLWKGRKHRQFNQMFIHGIDSDLLEIAEYNSSNLEETIKKFLRKYQDIDDKSRFNLVLDNLERSYIDWAQYKHGKSRTQIIREALRDAIDKDTDYDSYLLESTGSDLG